MTKARMEQPRIMIIPKEILEDIFTRLHALYFAICRCVCKTWNNILRNPRVIQAHIKRIKSKRESMGIILSTDDNGFFSTLLKYDEVRARVGFMEIKHVDSFGYGYDEVLASSDGLVLVHIIEEDENEEEVKKLVLLNPTTGVSKELPLPLPLLSYPSISSIRDKSKFAIGYDLNTNDYKVLLLWFSGLKEVSVDVYSVRYGTWNTAGAFPYHFAAFDSWVNFEGCVRWLMSSEFLDFNLGISMFSSVTLPSMIKDVPLSYVDEIADCLCCFDNYVWVMFDDSWIKFTIQKHSSTKSYEPVCLLGKDQLVLFEQMQWGLFAEDAGDENDDEDVDDTENRLIIYNLQYRSYQDILLEMTEESFSEGETFNVQCTYIETDISPCTQFSV